MEFKPYSEDISRLIMTEGSYLERAGSTYGNSKLNTAHLFRAVLSMLTDNDKQADTSNYNVLNGKIYQTLKETFKVNKFTIKAFTTEMKITFPEEKAVRDALDLTGTADFEAVQEVQDVLLVLKQQSIAQKRTMNLLDLLIVLLSNPIYSVYFILDNMYKTALNVKEDLLAEERALRANGLVEEANAKKQEASELFATNATSTVVYDIKHTLEELSLKSNAFDYSDLDDLKEIKNLSTYVKENPQMIFPNEDALNALQMALAGKTSNSVCIVGKPGTGKTALVYDFINSINNGTCHPRFRDNVVYELQLAAIDSGSQYRGASEAKILNILKACEEHKEVILFIDEIHTICKTGGDQGGNSVANIIKPYISSGQVRIIGATTAEEYSENIAKDKAMARRLPKVTILEASDTQTIKIMEHVRPSFDEWFAKEMTTELITKIVKLGKNFNVAAANPAKSLGLMESAYSYSLIMQAQNKEVSENDIIEMLKVKYNIKSIENKEAYAEEVLRSKLFGQKQAITDITKCLKKIKYNLTDPNRPKHVIMMVGPTGVGKTESIRILAETYYGDPNAVIKLAGSEYSNQMDVAKLLGSAPGYVGSDKDSFLITEINSKPNSVILFDELEKFHVDIRPVLLNMMETGEITDNKGNVVSIRNSIIAFTANIGFTSGDVHDSAGFGGTASNSDESVMNTITNIFAPEFMGRVNKVITFKRLTNKSIDKIIEINRVKIGENAGREFIFTDADIAAIRARANIETSGARGVKDAVMEQCFIICEREEEAK